MAQDIKAVTAGGIRLRIVQMNIAAQLLLYIQDPVVRDVLERSWKVSVGAGMDQLKCQPRAHRAPVSLCEIQFAKRQAPHLQLFTFHPNAPSTNRANLQRNQKSVKRSLVSLLFLKAPIHARSGRLGLIRAVTIASQPIEQPKAAIRGDESYPSR